MVHVSDAYRERKRTLLSFRQMTSPSLLRRPVGSGDGLTPFVDAGLAEADAALRAALHMGESYALGWTDEGEAPGVVCVHGELDGVVLPLILRPLEAGAGEAVWSDGEVELTVRVATSERRRALATHGALLTRIRQLAARGELRLHAAYGAAREALRFRDISDRVLRNIERTTGGLSGVLRTGFRCNQDCGFCWQGRDWPGPPDELYLRWVDEFAAAGIDTLTISGGEPTLYRGLPELIHRAHHDHGVEVSLQTNAIRFQRESYAARLRDAGLGTALVSLHAATPALSDALTRAPGTHVRTLRGIENALAAGIKIALNCVVEADNVDELDELAELVLSRFVGPYPDNRIVVMNFSQPSDYHDGERYRAQIAPLDRVRRPLTRAVRRLREAGVTVAAGGTCGFPLCVFDEAPELMDPPAPNERDEVHLKDRDAGQGPCASCAARPWCAGTRSGYRERFGFEGLRPLEEVPARLRLSPEERYAYDAAQRSDRALS